MDYKKYAHKLREIKLFQDLTDQELKHLISEIKEITLSQGEYLIKEGDTGSDFFFVEEGEVEILKENPSDGNELTITTEGEGKVVGELAMMTEGRREASIRALKPTRVLAITIRKNESDSVYQKIKIRISEFLGQKIKKGNLILIETVNTSLEHFKARAGLANLIVHLLSTIFLYIYAIQLIIIFKVNVLSSSIISLPVLSVFAISMIVLIKSNGYPLKQYGITWKGSRRAISESILYSIPLLIFIPAAKWAIIHLFPQFHNVTLLHISPALAEGVPNPGMLVFLMLVAFYAIFVPIQEFIFRGAIQSSLEQFLLGKHKTLQAILISNLPFSLIHLHLSLGLTIFVYFFGVFWGWLYARQQTLVGCSISHFLMGSWAFFIVGVQDVLIA